MSKIHPLAPITAKRETFTVWMKSLIAQGNGCTVFNEGGEIVYRVDNYDNKCRSEVYLMDREGNVLFTILKRKLSFSRQWTGYRRDASQVKNLKPFFQVRKNHRLFGEDLSCKVTLQSSNGQTSCYWLESLTAKSSAFRVVNNQGKVVAEANRKELPTGVLLGDDVLNLVVEPCVDHSLITALAVVYGLIHYLL